MGRQRGCRHATTNHRTMTPWWVQSGSCSTDTTTTDNIAILVVAQIVEGEDILRLSPHGGWHGGVWGHTECQRWSVATRRRTETTTVDSLILFAWPRTQCRYLLRKQELKVVCGSQWQPISELRGVTCHMESYLQPDKWKRACTTLITSQAGWYSIYLPHKDERLSWPGSLNQQSMLAEQEVEIDVWASVWKQISRASSPVPVLTSVIVQRGFRLSKYIEHVRHKLAIKHII